MEAATGFAVASAAHAGFQLTVTVLVYPALVEVGRAAWDTAHARHSRRIVPLVVLLYGALLATGAWTLAAGPGAWGWAALAATVGALATTAVGAAPIHGRLSADSDDLRQRLLVVDRLRCAFAVAGAVAATLALV